MAERHASREGSIREIESHGVRLARSPQSGPFAFQPPLHPMVSAPGALRSATRGGTAAPCGARRGAGDVAEGARALAVERRASAVARQVERDARHLDRRVEQRVRSAAEQRAAEERAAE